MGFNKSMLADEATIYCTFPHLYLDEDRKPIKFKFVFIIETGAHQEKLQAKFTGRNDATPEEIRLERFCLLIKEVPAEFEDFPREGGKSVQAAAREYFNDPRIEHIVRSAMNTYDRAVLSEELFR